MANSGEDPDDPVDWGERSEAPEAAGTRIVGPTSQENIEKALQQQARYSRAGLVVGFIVIGLGVVLLLLGVAGEVEINFGNESWNGALTTGAVGVVIALVGLGVIQITKNEVEVEVVDDA